MSLSCVIFVREAGALEKPASHKAVRNCLSLLVIVRVVFVGSLFYGLFELRADEFEDIKFIGGYGALVIDHGFLNFA